MQLQDLSSDYADTSITAKFAAMLQTGHYLRVTARPTTLARARQAPRSDAQRAPGLQTRWAQFPSRRHHAQYENSFRRRFTPPLPWSLFLGRGRLYLAAPEQMFLSFRSAPVSLISDGFALRNDDIALHGRKAMYSEMQRTISDQGSILIPNFLGFYDAHSAKVGGLTPIPLGALMGFGFAENVWLAT
jgi:hypothetical protein